MTDNQGYTVTMSRVNFSGQYGCTGKVKLYCEAWAKAEGYPLIFLKDAAQNSNADNPAQVNAEIQTFLNGLKSNSHRM